MQNGKFDIVNGKTKPLFLRYCIPNILGILALSSAQLIDAFFIGNYAGSTALAAINIVLPVFSLLMGVGIMLCTGGSVICAKFIGEKNYFNASTIFSKVIISSAILSALVTLCGVMMPRQIVAFLGANEELIGLSAEYLQYVSAFFVCFLGAYTLSVFARVEQRPLLAFGAILFGVFVNVILDWLFIFKFHWGVRGAAVATGLSQSITFFIIFTHFFSKHSGLKFYFRGMGHWGDLLRACYNGISELANEFSIGITTLIFNLIMIRQMGTVGVAAYTVINYALLFGTLLAYGIGDSIVPLISTNYGAKKSSRIAGFLRLSLVSGASFSVLIFFWLMFAPEMVVNFFLNEQDWETKTLALEFIDLLKWAFLFSSVSIILSSYFTAIEKPLESTIVALSRSLIFPVLFLMLMPRLFSLEGVFISIPLAELATVVIALTLLRRNEPRDLVLAD